MTALLEHTVLTVLLIAWSYVVTSRVPYRRAWIWTGTGLVVVVGYLSLTARSVFAGFPSGVQSLIGNLAAIVLTLSGIVCLALFGAVSRGANRSVAEPLDATRDALTVWGPRSSEASAIVAEAEVWEPGVVIDAGTWPSGGPDEVELHSARHAYSSPAERVAPTSAVAVSPWAPTTSADDEETSADEEDPGRPAPRRALASPSEEDDPE